ncbi:16224_t:CDS:2, partial [Cetraspora pellucida]
NEIPKANKPKDINIFGVIYDGAVRLEQIEKAHMFNKDKLDNHEKANQPLKKMRRNRLGPKRRWEKAPTLSFLNIAVLQRKKQWEDKAREYLLKQIRDDYAEKNY